MPKQKISLIKKYDIPSTFSYLVFALSVGLILTYFMPDADFGVIKIPKAGDAMGVKIFISGIVLLVLTVLLYIPFFKDSVNKNTPEYYLRSEQFQSHLSEFILNSKNEIIFWGGNFYMSTNERRDDLLKKLAEGVRIKYLIFNPLSPIKKQASIDFGENLNQFEKQCEITIQNLEDLQNRWNTLKKSSSNKGELEIRLYSSTPRLRAYFFDPANENSSSFFVHFLYQTDSSQLPMFRIPNAKQSAFENYLTSFNNHWHSEDVVTLEEYLGKNKSRN